LSIEQGSLQQQTSSYVETDTWRNRHDDEHYLFCQRLEATHRGHAQRISWFSHHTRLEIAPAVCKLVSETLLNEGKGNPKCVPITFRAPFNPTPTQTDQWLVWASSPLATSINVLVIYVCTSFLQKYGNLKNINFYEGRVYRKPRARPLAIQRSNIIICRDV
jgi:hypothetical protein